MSKFLFVCTGNTCRSPMAAAIFSHLFPDAEVSSAGLFADGSEYCQNSIDALAEIGISLSGNSRPLLPDDLDADRFFVMSEFHAENLAAIGIKRDKITVLDVSDPFGGDLSVYRACRNEIAQKIVREAVTIRTMTETDIPAVASIERQTFSEPWTETGLRESAENGAFFVADAGGKILGYMGATTALDEAYVTNVAVLPEYRGFGIGSLLIAEATAFCEKNGFSFITLEVRESNKNAISVYSKAGFESVGKRKNFYSNPVEDAILMTKEFKA